MQRLIATCLLAAALVMGFSPAMSQTPSAPAALDLFYLGNRASRLESCGCHSRQQGGVQYEAVLYEKNAGRPGLRLDLGDWTAANINANPVDLLLTRYLLRAQTMLGMDAVNVGPRDMELTADFFRAFTEKYSKEVPPLVSANVYLRDQPGKLAFTPFRIITRMVGGQEVKIGLTGVAWLYDEDYMLERGAKPPEKLETLNYVALQPVKALEPVISELRPKVDLLIVMSSGEAGSASEIAKAFPKTDIVIARNGPEAPQVALAQEGSVRLLFGRNSQGKELGYTPLERKDGQWVFTARPSYLSVNKDVEPKAAFVALIEEFKKDTQKLKPKLAPPGAKDLYAGDIMCQMCHAEQHAAWKKTPHARAMSTLVNKGQQFNPNCVKCHVTGFQHENGFYAMNDRPSEKMANVQCEVCHGPARIHAMAQTMKRSGAENYLPAAEFKRRMEEERLNRPRKEVPEKVCLACHTPENDDHFVYQEKLPKVKH